MNTRQTAWVAIATLTAAALGFAGARALATGAPQLSPLTYGGVLTDKDGKPYPSAQDVVLKFYDKVDATVAKCTAPAAQAEAGTGRFSVVLPGECAQAVRDTPDLWSEATVGGGKTVLPRVHVGAVPYALEADSAKVAAGLQCVSCVKVSAMKFDQNVDLQGHDITTGAGGAVLAAGKLDLGGGAALTGNQLKTLVGGGNADALHTHAGNSAGGGGQVITYKGVSGVKRVPAAGIGRSTFDADCSALYPNARMCTSDQIIYSYPTPVPGQDVYVFNISVGAVNGGTAHAAGFQSNGTGNCSTTSGTPFTEGSGSSSSVIYLSATGNWVYSSGCSTARAAACCGP